MTLFDLLGFLFLLQLPTCISFHNSPLAFQSAVHGGKKIEVERLQQKRNLPTSYHSRCRNIFVLSDAADNVEDALYVLQTFDEEYIERMKLTRASTSEGKGDGGLVEVKTPKQVEFERAQILKVVMTNK